MSFLYLFIGVLDTIFVWCEDFAAGCVDFQLAGYFWGCFYSLADEVCADSASSQEYDRNMRALAWKMARKSDSLRYPLQYRRTCGIDASGIDFVLYDGN